jgi:hypothetical protein
MRHIRRAGKLALAAALLAARAQATTWYFDTTGSDAGAGTQVSPWRTWNKFTTVINAGTVHPGDTVLFRPGEYNVCDAGNPFTSLDAAGGTPGNPITISVDTAQAGDVLFTGSARKGICGITTWNQANQCTTGPWLNAACDSNADCAGGTCAPMPGVWWTIAASDNASTYFGGMMGGAAFQLATTVGAAPKIYERLWAPSGSAQVHFPTFTAGHAQMFPYATLPAVWQGTNACTADHIPWLCCTGLGTGTCSNSRMYVQTESGAAPDAVADANFGPVEFPVTTQVLQNFVNLSSPIQYLTFTNHGNGRQFHFWWGITGIMLLKNADQITFEDSDFGYRSRIITQSYLTNGQPHSSGFPPYDQGDSYMITGWNDIGTNVVRGITFRRSKIHGTIGNEAIHFLGGPQARFFGITFENDEIGDAPYAVVDGQSGTTLTPNAYTNQVQKFWPPPTYSAWSPLFGTHWGPLGGGGNTDGQFISTSDGQTIRGCYLHDGGLISFFEGHSSDLLFEGNWVDLARMNYTDGGYFPPDIITNCHGTSGCGGLDGRIALAIPTRFPENNVNGIIVRNNVFDNVYDLAVYIGSFSTTMPAFKPVTQNQFVNNTFHVKLDGRTASPYPIIWFWQTTFPGWTLDDQSGRPFVFKNNLLYRDAPSAGNLPLLQIDSPLVGGMLDIDYNNWGGQNGAWKVGGTLYTSYASFKTAISTCSGCLGTNESHSLNSDPLFVTPFSNLSIQLASPSYQTGVDLSQLGWSPFSWDYTNASRPSGHWSMGAFQANNAVVVTTTTVATTSTSSSSTSSTTSTTTATTVTTVTSTSSTIPPTGTTLGPGHLLDNGRMGPGSQLGVYR